jgi:predicted hotdog family 3-hydroxylacyl-ACP dehydratase
MNDLEHYEPWQLLPHRAPMLMIGQVLACSAEQVRCTARIEADNPLLVDQLFPAFGGIELLAQASGILLAKREAMMGQVRPGAIAQIKRFSAGEQDIPVGSLLEIEANYSGGNATVGLFSGRVMFDRQPVLTGSLMIAMLPEAS